MLMLLLLLLLCCCVAVLLYSCVAVLLCYGKEVGVNAVEYIQKEDEGGEREAGSCVYCSRLEGREGVARSEEGGVRVKRVKRGEKRRQEEKRSDD